MKPANRSIILRAALLAAIPVCFAPRVLADDRSTSGSRSKKSEDPFLNGAPLTFEQLLKFAGQDAIRCIAARKRF